MRATPYLGLACLLLLAGCDARSAGTTPDAAVLDTTPDALPDAGADPVDYCPLDVTNTADASGHSPLGPVVMPLAYVGLYGGECGGMSVVLAPDAETFAPLLEPPYSVDPSTNVLVLFPENHSYQTGWLSTGPVRITHYMAGESAEATGLITITAFTDWPDVDDPPDQPILEATFVIDASGWSMSGWIKAIHCAPLDVICV